MWLIDYLPLEAEAEGAQENLGTRLILRCSIGREGNSTLLPVTKPRLIEAGFFVKSCTLPFPPQAKGEFDAYRSESQSSG